MGNAIQYDLGRLIPLHKGEYGAAISYELNDIVSYNGSLYWHYSKAQTTGTAPTDSNTWRIIIDIRDTESYIAQATTSASVAETGASDAEAYAIGKRGEQDVSSDDPAYHNNAKYYSDLASSSASTASAAKTDAESAQTAAETAQTAAETAQTAAEAAAAELNDMKTDLDELKSDFYYQPISISTFTSSVTQAEMGSTVNEVTLSYAMNKIPDSLTLDSNALTPAKTGTEQLANLGLTANKTWTLVAQDGGSATMDPATSTKTVTLSFLNRYYYGAAASGTVDSTFVRALANNALTSTKARTFTVNAASGNYVWYAIPKRLGTCTFKVGGFDGGFENALTVSVTNASGYAEDYYVYRSTNSGLGSTTVVVS